MNTTGYMLKAAGLVTILELPTDKHDVRQTNMRTDRRTYTNTYRPDLVWKCHQDFDWLRPLLLKIFWYCRFWAVSCDQPLFHSSTYCCSCQAFVKLFKLHPSCLYDDYWHNISHTNNKTISKYKYPLNTTIYSIFVL